MRNSAEAFVVIGSVEFRLQPRDSGLGTHARDSTGYNPEMTRKKELDVPCRDGKPTSCVSCGKPLHRKSEYYCSEDCGRAYRERVGRKAPPFLSKWKVRKRKEIKDPLVLLRKKVRRKTNDLIRRGALRRGRCIVCRSRDVVPHHEDYSDPFQVIWLCEDHHEQYHEGKISLFDGKLRWDPKRLTEVGSNVAYPEKKYRVLREIHERKTRDDAQ